MKKELIEFITAAFPIFIFGALCGVILTLYIGNYRKAVESKKEDVGWFFPMEYIDIKYAPQFTFEKSLFGELEEEEFN